MNTGHYYLTSRDYNTIFLFESVSTERVVQKIIVYTQLVAEPPIFNLGLADIVGPNKIDDNVITNNGDLPKVMATVGRSLILFFAAYPDAVVYVKGNTASKTRLYQMVISRELAEMKKFLDIYGETETEREAFATGKNYLAFVITSTKTSKQNGNKNQ